MPGVFLIFGKRFGVGINGSLPYLESDLEALRWQGFLFWEREMKRRVKKCS